MVYGLAVAYFAVYGRGRARRCATVSISGRRSTMIMAGRIRAGFNNITGFSTVYEWWRFSLYLRGEYQYSPAGPATRRHCRTIVDSSTVLLLCTAEPPAGYDSERPIAAQNASGSSRRHSRFMCWVTRYQAANRTRGWDQRKAAPWRGRIMQRTSTRSGSTGSSLCIFLIFPG